MQPSRMDYAITMEQPTLAQTKFKAKVPPYLQIYFVFRKLTDAPPRGLGN